MSSSTRSTNSKARVVALRKGTTLEMVRLCCPDGSQASLISESFGLLSSTATASASSTSAA